MQALTWAKTNKNELLMFQNQTGIPALAAVAQMLHESTNWETGELSSLAEEHHNYAGLTWYEDGEGPNWQRQYGAVPVDMDTREVIGGENVFVNRGFARYPSFAAFLKGYAHLLTTPGWRYTDALRFASEPLLWVNQIARAGWATDGPQVYTNGAAHWMARLWYDYQDTLPLPNWKRVAVYAFGHRIAEDALLLPHGRTYGPVRAIGEAAGLSVNWDGKAVTMG